MRPEKVSRKTTNLGRLILLPLALLAANAFAQNPVPFVDQPLVPSAVASGGPGFTLTVNGTGFVSGATVNWNGAPLTTTFVSYKQLTATVPAANTASPGTASVTVVNPAPGGGASSAVPFPVAPPRNSLALVTVRSDVGGLMRIGGGDFNGDGRMDIAAYPISNSNSGEFPAPLNILLGRGDGGFDPLPPAQLVSTLATETPFDPVVADVNGDGVADLIVVVDSSANFVYSGYVEVFLGKGDGTFADPATVPLPFGPGGSAAVADLNGDGKLDMAVPVGSSGGVAVLLGNGDGSFRVPVVYPLAQWSSIVGVGDFNGDGKLDLAANATNGSFSVLLGKGDGTFVPTALFGTETWQVGLAIADFDGDGVLDMAVASDPGTGGTVEMFTGDGRGNFQLKASYSTAHITALSTGDFNGDGKPDLAASLIASGGSTGPIASVLFLLGNGDGTFQAVNAGDGGSIAPVVADFNGDGKLDLAGYVGEIGALVQPSNSTLWPANVVLPDQTVGMTTSTQEARLTNLTTLALNIAGVTITGPNAPDFAQTNTCGASLASGESCTFTVTFTPSELGVRSATLSVSDSDPTSPQTATLSGTGINPTANLSAANLNFANQGVLTSSAPQQVALTNSGVGPLTISNIVASSNYSQTNTCGTSVAQGRNCTINVTFTPTTGGTLNGWITITDNAADSPQMITLSGTGVAPSVTLSATSLDFGSQPVSVTSAAQAATLTNNGPGPLTVTSISAVGTNPGDFGVTTNCVGTVAPLASCTMNVTFTPSGGGARAAGLSISDNAAPSTQTIGLSGTGVSPTLTLGSASLTFADQLVGTASSPQTLNITNTGPGPATVTGIVANGDFSQTNNCPGTLAASAACQVNITFKPTAMGVRTGEINISDDANGSPQTINLTGTGIAAVASLAPASLTFSNQGVGTTSSSQTVTLSNTGTASLSMSSVVVNPGFAETNTCGASVGVGASCTISVTFSPSAVGTTLGQLTLTDSALDSPQGVPLTGTGINGAGVAILPKALSFPATLVGSSSAPQTLTLTNIGNAVLNIGGMTPTSDFVLATAGTTCSTSSSVAAGTHCAISVTFAPTAGGARTGAVTLADNASGSPQMVALSGTGEDFSIGPASGSSTTQSVSAGQTATYNLAFSPAGGFTGTATLTCTGAPAGATCTINPASLALSGTTAADATVTVTTTAKTMTLPSRRWDNPVVSPRAQRSPWGIPLAWLALLAILTLVAAVSHRRTPHVAQSLRCSNSAVLDRRPAEKPQSFWKTKLCATSLAVILLLVVIWAACGGGGAAPPPPAPGVSLSGTSLTFSNQNMGTTSTAQTVTLTNSGNAALSITGIALAGANSGDFAQTNTCGSSVSAGANCQIKATFSPSATGTRAGSVTITDDATGSPQSISLSGAGVPPATPPATYTLTVTATLTSSSGTLTHTIPLTLTVN